MAAVESRARRRLNRWDMPDPVYWVWKKLTSVKVAIVLIAVTALMSFISVVIPQVPAQFTNSTERIEEHVELQRGTWGPVTDVLAEFPWFYDAHGGIFNLFNQPYWFALVVILTMIAAHTFDTRLLWSAHTHTFGPRADPSPSEISHTA